MQGYVVMWLHYSITPVLQHAVVFSGQGSGLSKSGIEGWPSPATDTPMYQGTEVARGEGEKGRKHEDGKTVLGDGGCDVMWLYVCNTPSLQYTITQVFIDGGSRRRRD